MKTAPRCFVSMQQYDGRRRLSRPSVPCWYYDDCCGCCSRRAATPTAGGPVVMLISSRPPGQRGPCDDNVATVRPFNEQSKQRYDARQMPVLLARFCFSAIAMHGTSPACPYPQVGRLWELRWFSSSQCCSRVQPDKVRTQRVR